MRQQRGYSFQRVWGRWSRWRRTCHGERLLETRSRGTSQCSSPHQSGSVEDKSQTHTGDMGCRVGKCRANLTECGIKWLYRVKGYEQKLIEGLWVISLGDRGYTDKSFALIKMTDNKLSFSIKSIFSHLFQKCEERFACVHLPGTRLEWLLGRYQSLSLVSHLQS